MTTLKWFKHMTGVPDIIFSYRNELKLTQIDTTFPYSKNMDFNVIFGFITVF